MAMRLPGDLNVLPLELVWEILDQLFTHSPTEGEHVTHEDICHLNKLTQAHKNFATIIDGYFFRSLKGQLIRSTVQSDVCFPYNFDLEAPAPAIGSNIHAFKGSTGLVTNIVKDDCPSCFTFLQRLMPELELDGTWVTKEKTTLFAIAVCSKSLNMNKHFLSIESSHGSCVPLLARPIIVGGTGQPYGISPLQTVSSCLPDAGFIRELFAILMPRLHELNPPVRNGEGGLSPMGRVRLCKFLTVEQAVAFEKAGMPLYHDPEQTLLYNRLSYHSAVSNGPDFLDYLHQRIPVSGLERNRLHPICQAANVDRLDSVLWFQAHGVGDIYDTDKVVESWNDSAARWAALGNSDKSVEILKELLRPLDQSQFPPMFCPLLLQTVVRSRSVMPMRSFQVQVEEEQPDENLKLQQNMWAIQKCEYIISKFGKDFHGCTEAKKRWKDAITQAMQDGRDEVAACIRAGMPRD